jgi:twinkle protein
MELFGRESVEREDSTLINHIPCPSCGSQDNLAMYDDGHGYCFSPGCGYHQAKGGEKPITQRKEKMKMDFVTGDRVPLQKRCLSQDTVNKWDYQIGTFKGKKVQIANYRKAGSSEVVAQKLRFSNKDFLFIGDTKQANLFGKHLFSKGKMIVVTEGEIDAMSVSQAQGNKWPVVSIATGSGGAKRCLQREIEYLEGFDTIILMFDQDEAGKKAVEECVPLFSPGKVKIAHLPLKDASEMLQEGKEKEIIASIWAAQVWRPDGIVDGRDLWDLISTENNVESFPYPYSGLNNMTQGLRRGEIVTITAGSGVGKSQVCREIGYSLMLQGQKIGYLALEENNKRTALGFVGLYLNKPIHLQNVECTTEELKEGFDNVVGTGNLFLYDHWGSVEPEHLFNKIRYLVRGMECDCIILDHISIIISGLTSGGDERRMLDFVMTKLRSLVEELQCALILVSHLRRPSGDRGHEEGVQTSLNQLRGTHGIAQLSDIVIGCERNQQSEDHPNLTTVRILKNRWTGETGICNAVEYSKETGRMVEVSTDNFEMEEVTDNQDF